MFYRIILILFLVVFFAVLISALFFFSVEHKHRMREYSNIIGARKYQTLLNITHNQTINKGK